MIVLKIYFLLVVSFINGIESKSLKKLQEKEDALYWSELGLKELEDAIKVTQNLNTNLAKNIIIFVGDGLSLPTITAGRIYKAQYEGRLQNLSVSGEESLLSFEKFPHVGLSKTYCVDAQVTDSAASATAIFSGIKTKKNTLGYDANVVYKDPISQKDEFKVESVMTWAQQAGKDTGFVTTTRVSHATPAALYSHISERDWECDSEMGPHVNDTKDITWQLINNNPGREAKVILGGGRSSFLPVNPTPEDRKRWNFTQDDWDCRRLDGQNLIDQFLSRPDQDPSFKTQKTKFVENRDQLLAVDVNQVDQLLGLFSWGHMAYEYQRPSTQEPSLTDMTKVAVKMLQKNNDGGFFLMVEGGKIDKAHHDGKAITALHETMEFSNAVEGILEMVNLSETLIVVTADHSHTLEMAGYGKRGSDIRGILTEDRLAPDSNMPEDFKPYTILSYANGKGFYNNFVSENGKVSRVDLTNVDVTDFEYLQPATIPMDEESHSGADVGIFSQGPFSHLFHSVHEQSFIAYVMAYSACIGPFKDKCHNTFKNEQIEKDKILTFS